MSVAPRSSTLIGRARPSLAFWIVAATFTATTVLGTVPTPLYRLYQQQGGYGNFVATIIFAFYAFGILGALIFAGHLSDLFGRRAVLICATGVSALSALTFCLSTSLPALLAGRLLCGIGTGMVTTAATAYLTDLNERARPGRGAQLASVTSTACNLGGLGIGAAMSGLVASTLPQPLFTPYLIALVLLVVALPMALMTPETLIPPHPRPRYRIQRATIPVAHRRLFWSAALASGVAFAITGLFASQAPNLIAGALDGAEREDLSGSLSLIVFACAAVAQIFLARGPARRQVIIALCLLAPSFAVAVLGAMHHSLAVLLIGAALSGTTAGLCLTGAIATALAAAPPEHRGGTLKSTFVVAYSGLALPVIGFGLLSESIGFEAALWVYLAAAVAVTAGLVLGLTRTGREQG